MTNDRLDELQKMRNDIEYLERVIAKFRTKGYDLTSIVGGYNGDPNPDFIMDIDEDLRCRIINHLDKRLSELKTKFKEA